MAKELTINLDVDTKKLQRILKAVSKHTAALANELADIESEERCDCGGMEFYTEELPNATYITKTCVACEGVFVKKTKREDGE